MMINAEVSFQEENGPPPLREPPSPSQFPATALLGSVPNYRHCRVNIRVGRLSPPRDQQSPLPVAGGRRVGSTATGGESDIPRLVAGATVTPSRISTFHFFNRHFPAQPERRSREGSLQLTRLLVPVLARAVEGKCGPGYTIPARAGPACN